MGVGVSGFVTIERDLWDHELFADGEMTEREAWMYMIAQAAWKNTEHRVGKSMTSVPRGSFMVTLRGLQKAFKWKSDKRVRNFLTMLENEEMIGRTVVGQRNAPKTHVTIRNYNEYQKAGRTKDAPKTHRGRTKDAVKEQRNKITSNSNELQPEGVSDLVWADWKRVRKKPITETVMVAVRREADKLGWSVSQAVTHAAENSWQGFNSKWIKDENDGQTKFQQRGGNGRKSAREIAQELCSDISGPDDPSDSEPKRLSDFGSHSDNDGRGGPRMVGHFIEATG